jgi:hypothetical protein
MSITATTWDRQQCRIRKQAIFIITWLKTYKCRMCQTSLLLGWKRFKIQRMWGHTPCVHTCVRTHTHTHRQGSLHKSQQLFCLGGGGGEGQKCGNMGNVIHMFDSMWHVRMLPSDGGICTRVHTHIIWKHHVGDHKMEPHSYKRTALCRGRNAKECHVVTWSTKWACKTEPNSCKVGAECKLLKHVQWTFHVLSHRPVSGHSLTQHDEYIELWRNQNIQRFLGYTALKFDVQCPRCYYVLSHFIQSYCECTVLYIISAVPHIAPLEEYCHNLKFGIFELLV